MYYRLQQLELRFVRWNGVLLITSELNLLKQLFNALNWNRNVFNLLRCKVERVLEAVSGFTNPFSSSFEDNELYFLSFGAPAKPGVAKDLIEADDICRKAVAYLIYSLLVKKNCLS